MVIEHIFITTLDGPLALERARQFLERRSFYRVSDESRYERLRSGTSAMPEKLRLIVCRGEEKPAAAKTVADLPQHVSVEFDRGRVTLAAEIVPSPLWGGAGIFHSDGHPARMQLHEELLHAIATGLERTLTQDISLEEADRAWAAAEQNIAEAAAARRKRITIGVGIFILLIVLIIVFVSILPLL